MATVKQSDEHHGGYPAVAMVCLCTYTLYFFLGFLFILPNYRTLFIVQQLIYFNFGKQ